MKSLSFVPLKSLALVPSNDEPIQGEIVDEPPPSDIQPVTNAAPFSGNGLLWLIGLVAGAGIIVGAVWNESSNQKQTNARTTRRRTRRQ
ncbi:MAG TPA: hypothetical protein VGB07_11270 [Blastocatellia bacterium]